MSSSPITGYTAKLRFNLINYLSDAGLIQKYEQQNWNTVDTLLATLANLVAPPWAINTSYQLGNRVIDLTTGKVYICNVPHKSGVSSFSSDRGYNPSYWTEVTGPSGPQGIQGIPGQVGATGSIGLQGVQGNVGAQGIQGIQGLRGVTGSIGATGPIGITGPAGSSVSIKGTVASSANLPTTSSNGDGYITSNDGHLWVQSGSSASGSVNGFTDVGLVRGPQGIQGVQGVQGNQGVAGNVGATGPQGTQGNQGVQGQAGAQGAVGATGSVGATGAQGSQGPAGIKGDTGAQGAVGATGAVGSQGAQGNAGPQGVQGATGATGSVDTTKSYNFSAPQTISSTLNVTSDVTGYTLRTPAYAGAAGITIGPNSVDVNSGTLYLAGNTKGLVTTGGDFSVTGKMSGGLLPLNASIVTDITRQIFRRGLTSEDIGLVSGGPDCTAAITKALNDLAYSGHALHILPSADGKPYMVKGISPNSGFRIVIDGGLQSIVDNTNGSACFLLSNCNDWEISGKGYLDGQANFPAFTTGQTATGNGGAYGIACVNGAKNGRITLKEIRNMRNWPINLTGCTDIVVQGTTMHDCGNSCQFALGAARCHARDNVVYNIGDEAFSFYQGNSYCSVEDNTIYGGQFAGISILNDGTNPTSISHDILIRGNTVYNTAIHGITINSGGYPAYNVRILDNTVYDWGQGIYGQESQKAGGYAGIAINVGNNITIRGNVFSGGGVSNRVDDISFGILVQAGVTNITITDNSMTNLGNNGNVQPLLFAPASNPPLGVKCYGNTFIETRSAPSSGSDPRMYLPYGGQLGVGSILGADSLQGTFRTRVYNMTFAADTIVNITDGVITPQIQNKAFTMDASGNIQPRGTVIGNFQGGIVNMQFGGYSRYTYAQLPSPVESTRAYVTDGNASGSWGAIVSGGGGNYRGPLWSDGTNWRVG